LFASDLMREVLRALAEADPTRVVIFDAPPLLATTEAAVLARQVGQVVLVVEANKTPQSTVAEAIAQLEGCSNVSLVLNKTTGQNAAGYGYGYGYGSEAGSDGSSLRQQEAG
jgi:protein-tyrosine kinase